jgi:hypothetical protein
MLGMLEIESISSLFLPAGRQGGRGQSPALSNGVYFPAERTVYGFLF